MSEHKDASIASKETSDLLADLDAEFGKKPKPDRDTAAARNTTWHANNPQVRLSSSKGQLERVQFENYYDWEMHRQAVLDKSLHYMQEAGVPGLQWVPEALVTYIINQTCACCKTVCQFSGMSYVRFRGRRRTYTAIIPHPDRRKAELGMTSTEQRETYPTMLKKMGEVDANLLMYGLPGGDPLPDLVEELDETVPRCPGCIRLEMAALDLWVRITQPNPQHELDINIPLTEDGR